MYIHVSTPHVELQRIGGRSTAGINEKKKCIRRNVERKMR